METHQEFEQLANDYLSQHPNVPHEWRRIEDRWSGNRSDLVCAPGTNNEVFATLRESSIAVGAGGDHVDFETFGRDISQKELATEALQYFMAVLRKQQLVGVDET
jgi:hypothetical protein